MNLLENDMKVFQMLDELIQYGYDEHEGKNVLVIDGNMFIYDTDNEEEIIDKLNEIYEYDIDSIDTDTISAISDNFVLGIIEDNRLEIHQFDETEELTSVLNTQIKKIIKQLDLDGYKVFSNQYDQETEEEFETEEWYSREQVLNKNIKNNRFYHGTSFNYYKGIKSKGIMPTEHTNFEKIIHTSYVFISTKYSKALMHSFLSGKNNKSIPIVFQFKIEDPSKLVLDYDVALAYYGEDNELVKLLGYDLIWNDATGGMKLPTGTGNNKIKSLKKWEQIADKNSLNTKAGNFGYKGRIPASQIQTIFTDAEEIAKKMLSDEHGFELERDEINMTPYNSFKELEKSIKHFEELYMSEFGLDDEDDE